MQSTNGTTTFPHDLQVGPHAERTSTGGMSTPSGSRPEKPSLRRRRDDDDEDDDYSNCNSDLNGGEAVEATPKEKGSSSGRASLAVPGSSTGKPVSKRMRSSGGAEDSEETLYSANEGIGRDEDGDDGNDGEDGEDGDNGDDGDDVNEYAAENPPRRARFQPGAIVRVFVEHFVTYERAEFHPGPSLNMVIGPNGTGKSSLVCAICLGLGFHSNVLGRAAAFGDFVKHGRAYAIVEIELQRRPEQDRRNLVVRLRINREDNSRRFWLNGQDTSLRRLQALMQELRIQVDNLCQFLPQDRVAEFAGLNSVELLAKTLEAAAPLEMKQWQAELQRGYADLAGAEAQRRVDAERLRLLQDRHQAQEVDVERFREREQIQRAVDRLSDCRPFTRFYEARRRHAELKESRRQAKASLRDLQQRVAPSLKAVHDKLRYQQTLETVLSRRRDFLRRRENDAAAAKAAVDRCQAQEKEMADESNALRELLVRKRQDLQASRQRLTALRAKHRNKPAEFVAVQWNTKIREKEAEILELQAELRRLDDQISRIIARADTIQSRKARIDHDLAALDSHQGHQTSLLRQMSPDAFQAWQWLQQEQNKSKFRMDVFGPPMVTCSVNDARFADLVQSQLQADDVLCFTTQCFEDHKALSDQFYNVMGLSVTIRTCSTPLASYLGARLLSGPGELAVLGFDGLAIDYLEGPAPVLAMLCAERRLNSAPLSRSKPTPEQYARILARDDLTTWAAQDQSYRVNRRAEYGAHAVSTVVRDVRPGRFWPAEYTDTGEKRDLQAERQEIDVTLRTMQEEITTLRAREVMPKQRLAEVEDEIERLRQEKSELQTDYNRWQALPGKMDNERQVGDRIRREHLETRDKLAEVVARSSQRQMEAMRAVLRYTQLLPVLAEACRGIVEAELRLIEAKSDFEGLKAQNGHLAEELEREQQKVVAIQEAMAELRVEGAQALADAELVCPEGDGENQERSAELHALAQQWPSLEALDNEIAAEKAKLELTRVVDASVMDAFRRRAKEIAQLQAALATHEQECARRSARIAELRGRWEPRLDALMERINDAFSYNFEQINCAGEISVHKDDDFDKWAIDIRVKFRESEELQKLDQHRQSGGERAVSTIFYLMALQGMAQAPFRVVDEINQGMDPRNERMMHERMVEIACHEHASQYFLITPKLLPNLRYDENMTVLCIASGQYMPTGEPRLDFQKCLRIQRKLLAAA